LSARQADPFFTELLSGIADQAAMLGFDILVSTRTPGIKEEEAYRRLVQQQRVDGLIVAHPRREDWRIAFLQAQTVPFVTVGYLGPDNFEPGVLIDTAQGIKQGVNHLVSQGRNALALIPPPSNFLFADVCRQVFEEVVAGQRRVKRQISGQISIEIEAFSQKEGYRATQILLAETPLPDGIFACHDLIAMGAMAAIQDQGFEVGSDIAVIGLGDILLSEHAQPPLTSIHQPTYAMGQQACEMVVRLIEGQALCARQVIIEPWLVVRQSSGLALWL